MLVLQQWNGTTATEIGRIGDSTPISPAQAAWTAASPVASGGTLTLPVGYVVGSGTLDLYVDGVRLNSRHYAEIGQASEISSSVMPLYTLSAGSELVEIVASGGSQAAWTTASPVASGGTLALPVGYVVGSGTLSLYVDGLMLMRGTHYAERGSTGCTSTTVTIAFAVLAGAECIERILS